ncbi:MAG: DegT/DnrJ/EryC1/StrS family aminotransferase, partial [Candidatus Dormibacteraeota bacterium]|nr:DegT/DnrJ/EryC1/StrS family aminotransferase [Candidatus Dormibacteraeota bacterium]
MAEIPFFDLSAAHAELRPEIDKALARTVDSGSFILGDELTAVEGAWAAYTHAAHCVGVGNGLDALHLALRAMDVGVGCEVIVPSNTYIATWLAVTQSGAVPVPVEPDISTFNIDTSRIEAAITPRTRGVLPVHLYGQPADIDSINDIARRHGLFVLEDAAQAHGALYKGQPVGSLSRATAWSFYPSKNLGAMGDSGAVTTGDVEVAERVRRLRNYGSSAKNVNEVAGYNSRLDELQAAVLQVKLLVLDEWNARRRSIARRYLDAFTGTDLFLPAIPSWASPAWHLFVIRSDRRDHLRAHLAVHGVETAIHYPRPPHLQEAYQGLGYARGSLPIAERIHDEVLS